MHENVATSIDILVHLSQEECFESLGHRFIDIASFKQDPVYEVRKGGYCELQVGTLDSEIPSTSKLVAAKKLFIGNQGRTRHPLRLAAVCAKANLMFAGFSNILLIALGS